MALLAYSCFPNSQISIIALRKIQKFNSSFGVRNVYLIVVRISVNKQRKTLQKTDQRQHLMKLMSRGPLPSVSEISYLSTS